MVTSTPSSATSGIELATTVAAAIVDLEVVSGIIELWLIDVVHVVVCFPLAVLLRHFD